MQRPRVLGVSDRVPHSLGRGRHVDVRYTQRRERIENGEDDGSRGADRPAFTGTLDAERVRRARHVTAGHGYRGQVVGQRIVWVPLGIPTGRSSFEVRHLPPADHYRVTLWSYNVIRK